MTYKWYSAYERSYQKISFSLRRLDRCTHFTFQERHFMHRSCTTTRSGRVVVPPASDVPNRLVRFLLHPLHATLFETLDLRHAPIVALESVALQSAWSRMAVLKRLVLPFEGWSSTNCRNRFKSLPVSWDVPKRKHAAQKRAVHQGLIRHNFIMT